MKTTADVHGSSAHRCRELGWAAGSEIETFDGDYSRERITAVGETEILARELFELDNNTVDGEHEHVLILTIRNWRKVPT
jgi:hypothetical protein